MKSLDGGCDSIDAEELGFVWEFSFLLFSAVTLN